MPAENDFILGLLSAPHLGDTICTSSLPRKIFETYGIRPRVVLHPTTLAVFANNPYVSDLSSKRGLRLDRRLRGKGHIIQRLEYGLGLEVSPEPRPEVYLSDEEKSWAFSQKQSWPTEKPYCLMSLRSVTDGRCFADVNWQPWLELMEQYFTIIQPILTDAKQYRKCSGASYFNWPEEPIAKNAVVYENLDVRRFFSLFSAVDCYCGLLTGSSHLAAAFDLPSLVFVWDDLYRNLSFPTLVGHLSPQTFLYPQQIQVNAHAAPNDNMNVTAEFFAMTNGKENSIEI